MKKNPVRHFLANVICALVYNRQRRNKLRVILNSPVRMYLRFIRQDMGVRKLHHVHLFVGFRAKNLLISANDKYIYKFPLRNKNYRQMAIREERIVRALAPISPLYIPTVKLIEYRGILVRRYEMMNGVGVRALNPDVYATHYDELVREIATFVRVIGAADPVEIRDLKPDPTATPRRGYGWYHWDVFDNFLVDAQSGKIVAMIDWEDCRFGDFETEIKRNRRPVISEFLDAVWAEYNRQMDANS